MPILLVSSLLHALTDADRNFGLQMTKAKVTSGIPSGIGFHLESKPGASRSETKWLPKLAQSPINPESRHDAELQQEALADVVGRAPTCTKHWQLIQAHN